MKNLFLLLFGLLLLSCIGDNKNLDINNPSIPTSDWLHHFVKTKADSKQRFTISATRDTIITGKKGTEIFLPQGSFDEPITLIIQECYSLSDMIENNLNTISNNELLRSKGMVYLEARNEEDEKITPKKAIQLKFPSQSKDTFDLFYAETKNGRLNWLPQNQKTITTKAFDIPQKKPSINQKSDNGYLSNAEPLVFIEEFSNPIPFRAKEVFDKHLIYPSEARKRNLKGKVYIEITIDEEGNLIKAIPLQDIGGGCAEAVINAIHKITKWRPAYFGAYTRTTFFTWKFNFGGRNEAYKITYPKEVLKSSKRGYTFQDLENKRAKRLEAQKQEQTALLNKEREKLNKLNNASRETVNNIDQTFIAGYIFNLQRLGWINCDKYIRTLSSKKIKIKSDDQNEHLMIVYDSKSLDLPIRVKSGYIFERVIPNQKFTIIGIKKVDQTMLYAFHRVDNVPNTPVELEYKAIDYTQLKKQLDALR